MTDGSNRSHLKSLQAWRDERGLSQRELARRSQVSQGMISQIEAGNSTPNILLAFALADALEVSERDILWPETTRYGAGSKPSIAQAAHQQRKREQRAIAEEAKAEAKREAATNPSDSL